MADVKISALPDATTVGAADEFAIIQGGTTKRATLTELKAGLSLAKADVGLSNVDNTSDANKPVSTAQATADTAIGTAAASALTTHAGVTSAVHGISAFGATLVDDVSAAVARTTLGVAIGTDVDAFAATASQAEAEAGSSTSVRNFTPQRVAQAIAALGGGGSAITVQDEGTPLTTAATTLNFTGAGVTATGAGATKTIDIPGAGSATITVKENGTNVSTVITALDFLGADFDVTESPSGEANIVVAAAIARTAAVQPLDTDLTAIAALTSAADKVPYATGAGTWALADLSAAARTVLDDTTTGAMLTTLGAQPVDADLTTIAGLTATTDNFLQSKSSAWASRTPAQVNTDLIAIAPTVVVEATATRTLAASDNNKIIRCTSASATTITVGTAFSTFGCVIERAGTGVVTLVASGTTLNGPSLVLNTQYAAVSILPTGSANTFDVIGGAGVVDAAEETLATAGTMSVFTTASRNISSTGTTTVTSFGTGNAGDFRVVRAVGAGILTHNATSLILPGGANITTAAGDRYLVRSLGTTNAIVDWYTKADGTAVVAPGGGGDVSKVGTPANNQIGVWTGNGTIEGDAALTYDGTNFNLATAKNFQIAGGTVLADAAGTLTLSGIDAIDATTEATIEAAIDTLANLTSVQGQTVTLTGALIRSGAHSLTLTTTGTTAVTLPTTGTIATQTEAKTEQFCVACSDETTALTTGAAKVTFRMPYAMTLTSLRASVTTAPTGAILIVDVNDSGTTVMTTNKLSIDATEKTSTTAATAHTLTDTTLADDAEITIDIDQVGSTVAGAGLKVWFIGTRA